MSVTVLQERQSYLQSENINSAVDLFRESCDGEQRSAGL